MNPFDVEHIPLTGRNLVDASAGTGKTFAIATLFVRLLLESDLAVNQILVVTFTEAATAELRGRIRERLREGLSLCKSTRVPGGDPLARLIERAGGRERAEARLRQALREFDRAEISTIHGFCQRRLLDQALASDVGYAAELEGDARARVRGAVLDFWAQATPELPLPLLARVRKFGLRSALSLAMKAGTDPWLRLLPERLPPAQDLDEPRDRVDACVDRVRGLWSAERVDGLLGRADSGVDRRSYSKSNLPRWLGKVTEYLSAGAANLPPKELERFTLERLRLAKAKDHILSEPVFRACSDLQAAHEQFEHVAAQALLRFKLELVGTVRKVLPEQARQDNLLTFDDLLQRLSAALQSPEGQVLAASLRERHPRALIDEFQDTDPTQCEIFERIYNSPTTGLFLIGDPKQAIYSFRGADIFAYIQAKQRTPPARRFTMSVNYRSDPAVLSALNHVFEQHSAPFLFPEIEYTRVEPRPGASDELVGASGEALSGLELLVADTEELALSESDIPKLIAQDIVRLLKSRPLRRSTQPAKSASDPESGERGRALSPADVAVLTRTNAQSFAVQDALRAAGIPAVVLGERSVYETAEAEQLERLLSAIAEPEGTRLMPAALATDLLGVTASALEALARLEGGWEHWVGRFRAWHQIWVRSGFVQMMNRLSEETELEPRVLRLLDGERRLTNLRQLVELLQTTSAEQHLGPVGLLGALRTAIAEAEENRADDVLTRLESDEEAVKITTCHRSKGLEYPVVYCPYLWFRGGLFASERERPLFHDPGHGRTLDIGSEELGEHAEAAEREAFAESLRLAYVGLTRARHLCIVLFGIPLEGAFAKASESPLAYLLFPPAEPARPFEELAKEQDARSPASWRERLHLLSQQAGIRVRAAESLCESELVPSTTARTALDYRRRASAIDDRYRMSSFSALTRAQGDKQADPWQLEDSARDHDAELPNLEGDLVPPSGAAPPAVALRLAEFPRGARAGSFFHEILEQCPFDLPSPDALRALVAERLHAYQYDPGRWLAPVCEQLFDLLATPLPTATLAGSEPLGSTRGLPHLRLCQIAAQRRRAELEFVLPVCARAVGPDQERPTVRAADLVHALRVGAESPLPETYLNRLGRLRFVPLRGFVRGFIDLVFEYEGRYYLVDYKATHLGDSAADYGPSALEGAMTKGHYYLQYYLYALALLRLLALRIPDFDYERHFGGVHYLFLRGTGPAHHGAGIMFDRPPLKRLLALSELLGLPEPPLARQSSPGVEERAEAAS